MPSENLEQFFKKSIREFEKTSLPQSVLDKDAVFLKVQCKLTKNAAYNKKLYYSIAASLLLGLCISILLIKHKATTQIDNLTASNINVVKSKPAPVSSTIIKAENKPARSEVIKKKLLIENISLKNNSKNKKVQQLFESQILMTPKADSSIATINITAPYIAQDSMRVLKENEITPVQKNTKIVVVLGGNTLSEIEKDYNKGIATSDTNKTQEHKRIGSKAKQEKKQISIINRVKNPLSINKKL